MMAQRRAGQSDGIIHGGHYSVSGAPLSFSTGWELGGFYNGTLRGIAQRLAGDDARRVRVVF